jgi:hypothetical protein
MNPSGALGFSQRAEKITPDAAVASPYARKSKTIDRAPSIQAVLVAPIAVLPIIQILQKTTDPTYF